MATIRSSAPFPSGQPTAAPVALVKVSPTTTALVLRPGMVPPVARDSEVAGAGFDAARRRFQIGEQEHIHQVRRERIIQLLMDGAPYFSNRFSALGTVKAGQYSLPVAELGVNIRAQVIPGKKIGKVDFTKDGLVSVKLRMADGRLALLTALLDSQHPQAPVRSLRNTSQQALATLVAFLEDYAQFYTEPGELLYAAMQGLPHQKLHGLGLLLLYPDKAGTQAMALTSGEVTLAFVNRRHFLPFAQKMESRDLDQGFRCYGPYPLQDGDQMLLSASHAEPALNHYVTRRHPSNSGKQFRQTCAYLRDLLRDLRAEVRARREGLRLNPKMQLAQGCNFAGSKIMDGESIPVFDHPTPIVLISAHSLPSPQAASLPAPSQTATVEEPETDALPFAGSVAAILESLSRMPVGLTEQERATKFHAEQRDLLRYSIRQLVDYLASINFLARQGSVELQETQAVLCFKLLFQKLLGADDARDRVLSDLGLELAQAQQVSRLLYAGHGKLMPQKSPVVQAPLLFFVPGLEWYSHSSPTIVAMSGLQVGLVSALLLSGIAVLTLAFLKNRKSDQASVKQPDSRLELGQGGAASSVFPSPTPRRLAANGTTRVQVLLRSWDFYPRSKESRELKEVLNPIVRRLAAYKDGTLELFLTVLPVIHDGIVKGMGAISEIMALSPVRRLEEKHKRLVEIFRNISETLDDKSALRQLLEQLQRKESEAPDSQEVLTASSSGSKATIPHAPKQHRSSPVVIEQVEQSLKSDFGFLDPQAREHLGQILSTLIVRTFRNSTEIYAKTKMHQLEKILSGQIEAIVADPVYKGFELRKIFFRYVLTHRPHGRLEDLERVLKDLTTLQGFYAHFITLKEMADEFLKLVFTDNGMSIPEPLGADIRHFVLLSIHTTPQLQQALSQAKMKILAALHKKLEASGPEEGLKVREELVNLLKRNSSNLLNWDAYFKEVSLRLSRWA